MKPQARFCGQRCLVSALSLVLLNILLTGTAFAAPSPVSAPPPGYARSLARQRPAVTIRQASRRQPGQLRSTSEAVAPASSRATIAAASAPAAAPQSDLAAFVESVRNGQPNVLRGVYVAGVLALRVVQQAPGNANQVILTPGTTTQYAAANTWGVTGLLADDTASGVLFYSLAAGQQVQLVFGDGRLQSYHVSVLYRFRALSPNDPYSNFVDLATGETMSAVDLFNRVYAGAHHVTFQTCIAQDGLLSWGRLFVIANPD